MVKTIPLYGAYGQGKYAVVDDQDYDWLSSYRWHVDNHVGAGYASRSQHVNLGRNRYTAVSIRMHREIMGAHAGQMVDHVNGDTLDNRRCNLRFCSHAGNLQNVGKTAHRKGRLTTSQYKGVYWRSDRNCWTAKIMANRKTQSLGTYATEQEAARAYDEAARVLHGEFARLNLPGEI